MVVAEGAEGASSAAEVEELCGRRLMANASYDWVCHHLLPPPGTVDVWIYGDVENHETVGTDAGLRRALRDNLNVAIARGERINNVLVAIEEMSGSMPVFNARPLAADCAGYSAGDPYFDQTDDYLREPMNPVGVQGTLDEQALRDGKPLPTRRPAGAEGAAAFTEAEAATARQIRPGAANVDAHAFDEAHLEACVFCRSQHELRCEGGRTAPGPPDTLDAELARLAERGHAQAEQARADHIAANQLRCEAEEAATNRGGSKRRKGAKARKQPRRKSKRDTPRAKKNARKAGAKVDKHEGAERPSGKRRVRHVARPVLHSAACWFSLLFLRLYFGVLWTIDGYQTSSPHSSRMEELYPRGLLPDGHRPGEKLLPLHGPGIAEDPVLAAAYRRGMDKWRAVPGLCVPCVDLPPKGEELPPDWRPPWCIYQKVVLKEKDVYKSRFTKKDPKARCVCDLRQTNAYWRDGSMRYTGHEHFAAQVGVGDYISVVDISSFYLQLPLAEKMYRYFSFKDLFMEGREAWGTHTRLPFGAGLSPYYACQVSAFALDALKAQGRAAARRMADWEKRPRRQSRRGRGASFPDAAFARWGAHCKATAYVDDIALAGPDAEATRAAVQRLVALLNRLQIPAKDKELSWEPRQKQDFLGMQFNTMSERAGDGTAPCVEISLTADYRKYLQHQVSAVLERGSFEAATMASLIGCLGWAASVMVGGKTRLCSLYELKSLMKGGKRRRVPGGLTEKEAKVRAIKRSRSFAKTQREALCDLGWWSRHLASASWTGSRAVNWSDERPVVFCSDASGDLGWGFHRMTPDGGIDVDAPRGQYWDSAEWTTTQAREWEGNMLVKEMYPLVAAARRDAKNWRGRKVVFGVDNTGVVFGVLAGRVHCYRTRALMRELGDLMQQHQFELFTQWVPRELNVVADTLSRQRSLREAVDLAYPCPAA